MTSDRRYITVGGRRWRRADPGLDEPVRQVPVDELMAARRAVGKRDCLDNRPPA